MAQSELTGFELIDSLAPGTAFKIETPGDRRESFLYCKAGKNTVYDLTHTLRGIPESWYDLTDGSLTVKAYFGKVTTETLKIITNLPL
jgi:hypothetical protein